jgi:hypothetical protein
MEEINMGILIRVSLIVGFVYVTGYWMGCRARRGGKDADAS